MSWSASSRRSSHDYDDDEKPSSRRRHEYSSSRSRRSRSRSRSPAASKSKRYDSEKKSERRRRTGWDKHPDEVAGGGGISSADLTQNLSSSLGGNGVLETTTTASTPGGLGGAGGGNVGSGLTGAGSASLTGGANAALSNISLQAIQNKALCRIYVGSLDYYLTEQEIKQVFQAFGTIVAVDMPKEGNRSKGFCFIEYTTPEAASLSLKTMQGFVLKGRALKVGRPTAVGVQLASAGTTDATQAGALAAAALLSNAAKSTVSPSTSSFDISSVMEKVSDPGAAGAAAVAAMAATGGLGGGGGGIGGTATNSTNQNMSYQTLPNRIYVGNVPTNMGVEDIKKIFSVFGCINYCQLISSPENPMVHRGYGFIEYKLPEEGHLAIKAMNKFELGGRMLKVNYATALRGNAAPATGANAFTPNVNALLTQNLQNFTDGNLNNNANQLQTSMTGGMMQNNEGGYDMSSNLPNGNNGGFSSGNMNMNSMNGMLDSVNQFSHPNSNGSSTNVNNNLNNINNHSSGMPFSFPPSSNSSASSSVPPPSSSGAVNESCVIVLSNMVTPDEVDDDLQNEIQEECSRYGSIESVRTVPGVSDVRIFVCFSSTSSAVKSIPHLHGRWFGGKQIHCKLYDQNAYFNQNFSL